MSLVIYDTLEQGSEQWLAARCGLVTASVVGKLITPKLQVADNETSRGLVEALVAERITGHVEYVYPSRAMERGTLDEPYSRQMYADSHGPVTEIGFATNTFGGHTLGASPDGLCGLDGGIESKSRDPKIQLRTILLNKVPSENMAQVQACIMTLERDWWDYLSYAGGWPLHVIRVYPDPLWQAVIVNALDAFEENASRMEAAYRAAVGDAPIAPRIDHFADIEIEL
jgi:hypothetical protein